MRRASILRLGLTFCGSLMLWTAGVSAADAAPAPRSHARAGRALCDSRLTARRAHGRRRLAASPPRNIRGVVPIRVMMRRHVTGWLQRSNAKPLHDGGAAAIQNGAAVGTQDDPRLRASLEPLGLLTGAQGQLAVSRTVATRAPRGPPRHPRRDSPAGA